VLLCVGGTTLQKKKAVTDSEQVPWGKGEKKWRRH